MMGNLGRIAVISSLCLLPVAVGFAYGQKAVYEKPDGTNIGARVTFSYRDDSMFRVNTKPGFVTDIQLREGEELTYVAGGDTKSWLIDKAKVGNVQHVYIKPLEPDKHTNIVVNTDMHTYRFDVWSVMDEFDPLITFTFLEDRKEVKKDNTFRPAAAAMNRDYEIKAKKENKYKELIPTVIMDDGKRTYIRIPETNRYDMPVLYMINPWDKKQSLINYRVRDGYFVADVVMAHGRLLYHQKYGIDFYNRQKLGIYSKPTVRERVERIRAEEGLDPLPIEGYTASSYNPVEDSVYTVPQESVPAGNIRVPGVKNEDQFRIEDMYVPVSGKYPNKTEVAEAIAKKAGVPVQRIPVAARQPVQAAQDRLVDVAMDDGRVIRIPYQKFMELPEEVRANVINAGRARLVPVDGK